MDNPEVIGGRIRRLRLALGYDQARAFCQFVGFSDQALYNYETGKRRISLDEVMKIVTKTGASLDFIYRGLEHTLPGHVLDKLVEYDRQEQKKRAAG
ncbi:helix-turn-helix domain-containing protein [Microvirga lotononidis]|uniref:Putative transcriptional regulator n=1 Tax=Microvirga lotononidis TaxID=864069 RepID=I4YP23_9HYPH|nr:helix-turn-helix transcriptional regulator [Microvirga lotononidis]EIM25715.1 putative transcriptional regulator [Microvirga lotononidis]WQO25650.1 helix-turn-helix transcriptional regulator [Microvirga lotononidis]